VKRWWSHFIIFKRWLRRLKITSEETLFNNQNWTVYWTYPAPLFTKETDWEIHSYTKFDWRYIKIDLFMSDTLSGRIYGILWACDSWHPSLIWVFIRTFRNCRNDSFWLIQNPLEDLVQSSIQSQPLLPIWSIKWLLMLCCALLKLFHCQVTGSVITWRRIILEYLT